MPDVKCSTCGQLNPEDHNFCDHCNAPLFSFESLAEDEPTVRDDLLSDDQERSDDLSAFQDDPSPPADQYLPSDDSLIANLRDDSEPAPPGDESSRLDDFISPLADDSQQPEPKPADPLDESSRLDDYLSPDASQGEELIDRISAEEPIAEEPAAETPTESPPPLDPFLEPDPREDLLGDLSSEETTLESWDLFTEPPDSSEQTPSQPERIDSPGEWEYITPGPEESPKEEEPADELDFLASLTSDDSTTEPEQPAQEPSAEWDFLTTPDAEGSKADDETPAEEPVGDWDFLTAPSTEEPEATSSPSDQEPSEEWDFLTSPTPEAPSEPAESPAEDTASEYDFLTSLPADPPVESPADPVLDHASDLDLPAPAEEPPPSPQEEPPAQDPLESLEPPASPPDEESVPDELDFLAADTAAEPITIGFSPDLDDQKDSIPEFGSPGFDEESGWMDMLAEPGEIQQAEPETLPEPKKPQTDWLEKIKRLNKSTDLVDDDSSFPDWLSVSERPAREEPEMTEPPPRAEVTADEEEAVPGSSLPDWLQLDDDDESLNEFLRKKDLTNEEYKPAIVRGITDKLPPQEDDEEEDDDEPATELSDSQQIKFPSWAGKGKPPGEQPPEGLGDRPEQDPQPSLEPLDPFKMDEVEDIDDLFSDELPGWLTSDPSEAPFEDFEDELTTGDLPGWVEAMRPVIESADEAGVEDDEEYIENYGPLAGIPSVIPAEAEGVLDPEKVGRKPLDLVSTKSNKDYVEVLKTLIADESKSKTILKPTPVATQRVLRWLIAAILLVTTAGTVIFGGNITTEPPTDAQIRNTGYAATFDQIEDLFDGQPVLIAFDYQPAAAGELHTAAAGVIDHLMEQGTYLSFVSTQPTGPALAENFLATTQADHDYRHTQQYINLGYLPGEAAGLVSFVIAPKQIIPLAFDGSNAWDAPPLKSVESIRDFEMVLVITDDPDTAKIWIEQVATIIGDKPLHMVVSAQVEPLIQPYFRSSPQLLKGYVAGIIDSMNYEQLLGRPNLANKIWLPFNLGIIITVGTIFIGGLANGVLSIFSRHRSRNTGEIK